MATAWRPFTVDTRHIELLGLLELLLVGRVVLSLLPPGRIGSHRPDGLAATLSASLLLGFAVGLAAELPGLSGLPAVSPRLLTLLAVPVALVRWCTLPGAFVPAPFPCVDPATPRAVGWRWVAAAAVVIGLARAATTLWPQQGGSALLLLQYAPYLALPAVLDHGLQQLSLPGGPRTWVWIVPAALVWILPASTVLHGALPWVAFFLGAGTVFLLVWRYDADRRALALSALAFGAATCSAPAAWPLGLGGLAWLVLATPGGTRTQPLRWALIAVLLLGPVAATERSRMQDVLIDPADLPPTLQPPGVAMLLLAGALPLALISLATWLAQRPQEVPRA